MDMLCVLDEWMKSKVLTDDDGRFLNRFPLHHCVESHDMEDGVTLRHKMP